MAPRGSQDPSPRTPSPAGSRVRQQKTVRGVGCNAVAARKRRRRRRRPWAERARCAFSYRYRYRAKTGRLADNRGELAVKTVLKTVSEGLCALRSSCVARRVFFAVCMPVRRSPCPPPTSIIIRSLADCELRIRLNRDDSPVRPRSPRVPARSPCACRRVYHGPRNPKMRHRAQTRDWPTTSSPAGSAPWSSARFVCRPRPRRSLDATRARVRALVPLDSAFCSGLTTSSYSVSKKKVGSKGVGTPQQNRIF